MKMPRIAAVSGKGTTLTIKWVDGPSVSVDLAADIQRSRALKPLRDAREFAKVRVGEGGHSAVWPSGVDLGADRLWRDTLLATGHADTVAFNDWRMALGLSLNAAAEALGLSRRMVAYYSAGEKSVPKTVLLACAGYSAQLRAA